jgi:hypothetical protein
MKIVTPAAILPRESHPRPIKIIRPVSFSPVDLFRELRGLWQYRDLFYTLTVHRYKSTLQTVGAGIGLGDSATAVSDADLYGDIFSDCESAERERSVCCFCLRCAAAVDVFFQFPHKRNHRIS